MLSIRSSYNRSYGTDKIYSISPSPSFENDKSSLFNFYNHYKETHADTIMNEQHNQQPADLTFHSSDWPTNKSPQTSFVHHRDDLYPSVDGDVVPTSYSNYENYEGFSDDMTNNIHIEDSDYHNMSWTSADDNSMANIMTIGSTIKHDNYSPPDSYTHNKKHTQFSSGDHLLNLFPAPAPPAYHGNMFYQRPNYTTSYPCINKGDKYHTRFKSANARLSPFTEQQETYQQLLSTSSSSSPPQQNHFMQEKLAGIKNETQDITDPHYYYHDYQTKKEISNVSTDQKSFQFNAVLFASTAVKKKHDELPVTYLNRGQAYLVDLSASSHQQQCYPASTITSTLSIAFHDPNHRQLAESYWRYWIGQQETPKEARAIDLDTNQTTGIYNVRHDSFDRVSFDWHSRFGAKVYVRFNCLSTDFSRIKGVKGIPLRFVMETNLNFTSLPNDYELYKGAFEKSEPGELPTLKYKELCYCKVKLFRDKGAERKNKDDKKQMAKQMEKVIASTNGNPQQHPLWPIISQSHKSTSNLSLIPNSPDVILTDFDESSDTANLLHLMALSSNESQQTKRKRDSKIFKKTSPVELVEAKKSRNSSKPFQKLPNALCFYVWTRHIHSTPHEVYLHQLTTHQLKVRLGAILSLHPAKISEILWKRKKSEDDVGNDVLVLVEDTFIAEHIADGEMMTVDLEVKADGNFRLVLEF